MLIRGTYRHRPDQPLTALRGSSLGSIGANRSRCEPTTAERLLGRAGERSADEPAGGLVERAGDEPAERPAEEPVKAPGARLNGSEMSAVRLNGNVGTAQDVAAAIETPWAVDGSAAGGGTAGFNGFNDSQVRSGYQPVGSTPGSLRHAAGGTATIGSLNAWLDDGHISRDEVRGIVTDTGISAAAARTGDAVSSRLGNLRGGAIVDSVVTIVTSVHENNASVADGKLSAGAATAAVMIDAAVGVSAGMAGLTAGAMVGSALPVVGTAVGAVAGFAVGSLAAWGAVSLGNGLLGGVKQRLGEVLEARFEQPLQTAWGTIDAAKDAVKDSLSNRSKSARATLSGWFGT